MSLFMQNIWVIKRFMSTNMLSKIASASIRIFFLKKREDSLCSIRIWPNAYAANKFNLCANGFLKSFGKDKAYTLTKKVNNPAFVYCDILGGGWGEGGQSLTIYFSLLTCDQAVLTCNPIFFRSFTHARLRERSPILKKMWWSLNFGNHVTVRAPIRPPVRPHQSCTNVK